MQMPVPVLARVPDWNIDISEDITPEQRQDLRRYVLDTDIRNLKAIPTLPEKIKEIPNGVIDGLHFVQVS